MSNLVEHARQELKLRGDPQEDVDWYLKVIQAFVDYGHSGSSAAAGISTLNALLQFKNLMPLTDNPREWMHISGDMWGTKDGVWQCARCPEAFSNDGGKTYYLLSEGGNDQHREPRHQSVKVDIHIERL